MSLSVLVNDGGVSRFGLRGSCVLGKRPSDWNKRERSGSVSNLDRVRVGRACKDGGVDDCVGGRTGGVGWKCCLGAQYLGGGVTAIGIHLLSVNGTGIAGHVSMIIVASGERWMERMISFVFFLGVLILLRGGRSSLFSLSYIVINLSAVMSDLSTH